MEKLVYSHLVKLTLCCVLTWQIVNAKPANLPETAAENRNSCKLLLQMKANKLGQFYVAGIQMPDLEQIIQDSAAGAQICQPKVSLVYDNKAKKMYSTKKTIKVSQTNEEHQQKMADIEQLTTKLEDDYMAIVGTQPLFEQQAVVYPLEQSITTLERYKNHQPDGTGEYKLALSNGLQDFKRIYNKLLANGTSIQAQAGYYSVPKNVGFQTQYYVADENGYRTYLE